MIKCTCGFTQARLLQVRGPWNLPAPHPIPLPLTLQLSSPFIYLSSPPSTYLPLPSFPLEVGPLNPARGLGEHRKLPQWGLGQSPSQNRI